MRLYCQESVHNRSRNIVVVVVVVVVVVTGDGFCGGEWSSRTKKTDYRPVKAHA